MKKSDYYAQMRSIKQHLGYLQQQKNIYTSYAEKLVSLQNDIPTIKDYLSNGLGYYQDGGYIDDNGTLDHGLLSSSISRLDTCITNLSNIVSNTSFKVSEIISSIEEYNRLYAQAYGNYLSCEE